MEKLFNLYWQNYYFWWAFYYLTQRKRTDRLEEIIYGGMAA